MAEIITKKEGPIGNIIFSNPQKMNAMSLDMWLGVPKAMREFDQDPEVRVIVVKGSGEKAFISGADISQFDQLRGSADQQEIYNQAVAEAYLAPTLCSKPVVASIRGYCFGGGLGFAVACDMRICSEDAQFRMPAARLGLGYGFEGVNRFINVIGPANTADIFFSARRFDAAEALRMGYVTQVHPSDLLEQETSKYVGSMAENAPMTMKAIKAAVLQSAVLEKDRDVALVSRLVDACFASEDYKEGRAAFLEKRTPIFRGV